MTLVLLPEKPAVRQVRILPRHIKRPRPADHLIIGKNIKPDDHSERII